MEFGEPHLEVREPRAASSATSPRITRLFARRLVVIRGDWHLFIEFARWRLTSTHGQTSSDLPERSWRVVLNDLSGQRLVSAKGPALGRLTLRFDLGAELEIGPDPDIDNDIWTLHHWRGDIVGCSPTGEFEVERPTSSSADSLFPPKQG